jgi:hypothetical protein
LLRKGNFILTQYYEEDGDPGKAVHGNNLLAYETGEVADGQFNFQEEDKKRIAQAVLMGTFKSNVFMMSDVFTLSASAS